MALVSANSRCQDCHIAYFSARLPDGTTKCGQQKPITGRGYSFLLWRLSRGECQGWTEDTSERWWDDNGNTLVQQNTPIFDEGSGIFTTPLRGVYQCCASFRCKQGGVCDFTIIRNAGNGDVVWVFPC